MRKSGHWKTVLHIFFLSRAVILIFTYFSVYRFPSDRFSLYLQGSGLAPACDCLERPEACFFAWWRWDVRNYIDIAYMGYTHTHFLNTAFFPLWPFCIRLLGLLIGGTPVSMYIAGLLLANMAFLLACLLFYSLVCLDFSARIARYATILLVFNPYGLFFFAGYTESLFLLFCLFIFWLLRRSLLRDWWLAGLCGYGALLTRTTGVALAVPFVIAALQQVYAGKDKPHLWGAEGFNCAFGRDMWLFLKREKGLWLPLISRLLPLLLLPAGLLTYMAYLKIAWDNPLAFHAAEAMGWGRVLSVPGQGIVMAVQGLFSRAVKGFSLTGTLIDLVFVLLPIAILISGWRLLSWQYRSFCLALFLLALSFPYPAKAPLLSTPRYLMVAFPLYIVLALWCEGREYRYGVFMLYAMVFIGNVTVFATGRWVA